MFVSSQQCTVHSQSNWQRWIALGLIASAIVCFIVAYFFPWWHFVLYAPQYPDSLRLTISLTGVSGDVREVDMLNHYFGMGRLVDAALVERKYAAWGVGFIALCMCGFAPLLMMGRKIGSLIVIPAVLFPVGFVVDVFYWLYTFGHRLDPKAPIRLPEFTPQMFGNGQIGQFMTFATPLSGFWLSVAGAILILVAVLLRPRIAHNTAHTQSSMEQSI